MLEGDIDLGDERPAIIMAICNLSHIVQQESFAPAIATADEDFLTDPMTRRVTRSSHTNTAEEACEEADGHGHSALSKDSSVAQKRMTVWAMTWAASRGSTM